MKTSLKKIRKRNSINPFLNNNLIYIIIIILFISFLFFMLNGCATTQLADSWKNPAFETYKPNKVMVIGVTQNTTARMIYEQTLKNELNARGIDASQSGLILENSFKDEKQTEKAIDQQVDKFLDLGYDAILVSAVKGIDERIGYTQGFPDTYFYLRRFNRHYYLYQNIYFEPSYYNKYKIYHIETALYNIKDNSDKSLVWVGSYDLVNPIDITKTVNHYVRIVTQSLENERLIPPK